MSTPEEARRPNNSTGGVYGAEARRSSWVQGRKCPVDLAGGFEGEIKLASCMKGHGEYESAQCISATNDGDGLR